MRRGNLGHLVCLLTLLLVLATACGGPAQTSSSTPANTTAASPTSSSSPPVVTTTKPSASTPQYGGILTIPLINDVSTFDQWSQGPAAPVDLAFDRLWDGDWAKGPASGFGTNEADWTASTNIRALKTGYLAESVNWAAGSDGKSVTAVIKVRQGIHFALTKTDAGKLVNGREITADDVLSNLDARMNDSRAMQYQFSPFMRGVHPVKTGSWEISLTLPVSDALNGFLRLFDGTLMFAPEVLQKYGNDMSYWYNNVGTGAFMLTDYVAGSVVTLDKNPNYYLKDPVGPGKGSQLPYLDRVKYLVIPDVSTREAALRTAKLDQMGAFTPEDARQMAKQVPALKQAPGAWNGEGVLFLRTDKAPFNDIRVRRALMMATDFNSLNKSFYSGLGQILSWPYWKAKEYAPLYLGLDDPAMPASVKEIYTYSPDKAKQLLKDAGYPNGFKGEIVLQNLVTAIDYISAVKDMWAKVGVDVSLSPKELISLWNIQDRVAYDSMTFGAAPPNGSWPQASTLVGKTRNNASLIDDPKVTAAVAHWNVTAITDVPGAMAETKDLMKYVLDQAWVVPAPRYPQTTFWWPWVKNYSGETTMGWIAAFWPRYVWVDQQTKKSMGY